MLASDIDISNPTREIIYGVLRISTFSTRQRRMKAGMKGVNYADVLAYCAPRRQNGTCDSSYLGNFI
jgi:hypothetical protein